MNFKDLKEIPHQRIHRKYKGYKKFPRGVGKFIGLPDWAKLGIGTIATGVAAEALDCDKKCKK